MRLGLAYLRRWMELVLAYLRRWKGCSGPFVERGPLTMCIKYYDEDGSHDCHDDDDDDDDYGL